MAKHKWIRTNGEIDFFRCHISRQLGPKCMVCGKCFCNHCNLKGFYNEECSGEEINNGKVIPRLEKLKDRFVGIMGREEQ